MGLSLEICVDDPAGVAAAVAGGANRIELCSALALGGLTPSIAFTRAAVAAAHAEGVAVHAMVRSRAGDFAYDAREVALALADAAALIEEGVDGLVFGAARGGRLDAAVLAEWAAAARGAGRPLALTLHRAIDVTDDPVAEVETAIRAGFDYILTSGGVPRAPDAAAVIARMVRTAAGRCRIMPGSGVDAACVAALVAETGVRDVHASASRPHGGHDEGVARLGFDVPPRRVTDRDTVRALRAALDRVEAR